MSSRSGLGDRLQETQPFRAAAASLQARPRAAAWAALLTLLIGGSVAAGGPAAALAWIGLLLVAATLAKPAWAFYACLLALPAEPHLPGAFIIDAPLDAYHYFVLAALLLAQGGGRLREVAGRPGPLLVAAYGVAAVLSIAWLLIGLRQPVQYDTWRAIFKLGSFLALAAGAVVAVRGERDLRLVYWLLMGGLTASSLYAVYQYAAHDFGPLYHLMYPVNTVPWADRPTGLLNYANEAAGYVNLLLPVAAVAALVSRSARDRWLSWGAVALGLTVLFLTQSRGSWLALAAMSLLVVLWAVPARWRLVAAGAAAVIAYLLVFQVPFTAARLADVQDTDVLTRQSLWSAAIDLFKLSPLFGVGIGSYQDLYHAYIDPFLLAGNPTIQAHELYLQILAETGLLGLAAFAGVCALAVWTGWRAHLEKLKQGEAIGAALYCGTAIAVVGVLAHGFIDVLFQASAQFSELFWVLVALCLCAPIRARTGRPRLGFVVRLRGPRRSPAKAPIVSNPSSS